jgi:hypothetical protein
MFRCCIVYSSGLEKAVAVAVQRLSEISEEAPGLEMEHWNTRFIIGPT